MNANETIALIAALKNAGATHFKSNDFEVSLKGDMAQSVSVPIETLESVASKPQGNPDATQKLKDLISTLKMDDAQLLDKIFPAGAGG
jgi:hypothetical protein